jgi:hypothetical protein
VAASPRTVLILAILTLAVVLGVLILWLSRIWTAGP